jgi:hypothetical protein
LSSGQLTTLYFFPGATLKGGSIDMTDANTAVSGAFTNVDGVIGGAGVINAEINNLGIIDADGSTTLTITGPITNALALEATDGELDIKGNVTNTAGGGIFSALGSIVAVFDARITGGTLPVAAKSTCSATPRWTAAIYSSPRTR